MHSSLSFRSVRITVALLALAVGIGAAATSFAQTSTQVLDASALRPPAGARVAIVEFDDLQCPACAAANPTIMAASAKYKIPWVRHDFLIPYHNWSRQAAVNARWFDTKSQAIGDEYRNNVFANQASIYNLDSLAKFTQQFAQGHGIQLPFAMDPQGKLIAAVNADVELGKRTGVKSTPTVFIVTSGSKGAPFIQVANPALQLYTDIDQAMADTAQPAKPAVKKAHGQ